VTAAEIIAEANRRGVVLAVRDGQIVARPAGALPPEFKAAASEKKIELISMLSSDVQGRGVSNLERADLETERYVQRDIERYETDKAVGRGYDVDPTAPSHYEWAARNGHYEVEPLPLALPGAAAKSLIRTCREHGVRLSLDSDATLVVISNGRAWRSLVDAIEAHVDTVAALIAAGWDGCDA
jgi:hypothetical protein